MATEDYEETPKGDTIVTVGEKKPPRPKKEEPSEAVNVAAFLSVEEQKKVVDKVLADFEADVRSREPHMKQLVRTQKLRACDPERDQGPFSGVPRVSLPIVATSINQVSARLWNSLLPHDGRWFLSKPTDDMDVDRASRTEVYLDNYLRREVPEFALNLYDAIDDCVADGDSYMKIYWDLEENRLRADVIGVDDLVLPYKVRYGDPSMRGYPRLSEVIRRNYYQLQRSEERGVYVNVEKIKAADAKPENKTDLQAAVDKVAGQDADRDSTTDEDKPRRVIEQDRCLVLPKRQGKHRALDGKLHYVTVVVDVEARVLLRVAVREEDDPRDAKRYARELEEHATMIAAGEPVDPEALPASPRQREICRYVNLGFLPSKGAYHMGLGALAGPLNIAVNELIRQRILNLALQNSPPGFVKRNFKMKRGDISTAPGKIIEVDAPGEIDAGIKFMQPPSGGQELFSLSEWIVQLSNRLTGSGEIFSGEPSGANETAKGMTIRNVEANTQITVAGRRVREAMKYIGLAVWRCLSVFLDEEEYAKVAQEDGTFADVAVTRADFLPDADVVPAADPRIGSRVQETEEAVQLVNAAMQLPALQAPPFQAAVAERVLTAMHEPKLARMVREMMEQAQQPQGPPPPKPQWDENAGFMEGVDSPVNPDDDDNTHMAEMDLWKADPKGYELLPPELRQMADRHYLNHAAQKLRKERSADQTATEIGILPQNPGIPTGMA